MVLQLVRQQHRTHELRAHVRVRVAVVNERRVRGVEWVDPRVIIGETYAGESEVCWCMSRNDPSCRATLTVREACCTPQRAHEAGASGRP